MKGKEGVFPFFVWMEMGGGEGRRNRFPSMPSKFLLPTLGGKVRKEKGHEMNEKLYFEFFIVVSTFWASFPLVFLGHPNTCKEHN